MNLRRSPSGLARRGAPTSWPSQYPPCGLHHCPGACRSKQDDPGLPAFCGFLPGTDGPRSAAVSEQVCSAHADRSRTMVGRTTNPARATYRSRVGPNAALVRPPRRVLQSLWRLNRWTTCSLRWKRKECMSRFGWRPPSTRRRSSMFFSLSP